MLLYCLRRQHFGSDFWFFIRFYHITQSIYGNLVHVTIPTSSNLEISCVWLSCPFHPWQNCYLTLSSSSISAWVGRGIHRCIIFFCSLLCDRLHAAVGFVIVSGKGLKSGRNKVVLFLFSTFLRRRFPKKWVWSQLFTWFTLPFSSIASG